MQGHRWPHMLISWVSTEWGSSEVRIRQGTEPFYCISQVLNHRWWNLSRKRFINGCWVAKLVLQWAKLGCQDSCSNTPGTDRQSLCPSCPRKATLYVQWQTPPLWLCPPKSHEKVSAWVCRAPYDHFWVSHRRIRNTEMELGWCWAYSITAIATLALSWFHPKINQSPCF